LRQDKGSAKADGQQPGRIWTAPWRIVAAEDRTERGIATSPFFLNGVVNVFEGLGGGSWIGGGYDEGEEAWKKSKRWGRNTTSLANFAEDGGLRTDPLRAIPRHKNALHNECV